MISNKNKNDSISIRETGFNLSDMKLWKKIQSGDELAFSRLFHNYYESLYQFAGRFIRDGQTAENIVQEVFVTIWTHRKHIQINSSLKSYLYTAVRNRCLNFLKQQQRLANAKEEIINPQNAVKSPEQDLIDDEFYTAVQQSINNLPPQCRHIYLMKRYDDLKYTEIAEILVISVNTVKTQMKRAIKSLLKDLSAYLTNVFIG